MMKHIIPRGFRWAGTVAFVLIVIALVVVPSGNRLYAEPAGHNVVLQATPKLKLQHPTERTHFGVGETFTIDVVAENMQDLAAEEFDLQVDRPGLVELLDAGRGPFLKENGRQVFEGQTVDGTPLNPISPQIDAGAGTLAFGDFSYSESNAPGADGSGVVASIEAKVNGRDGDFTNVTFDLLSAITVDTQAQEFNSDLADLTFTVGQFGDVPPSFWAFDGIQSIFDAGITSGCGSGMYCPGWKVARDQMAVFLVRALGESPVDPPTGMFGDVPPTYWAAGYIERLAELGITSGCGGGNFCPNWQVARDQIAVFLIRALGENPIDPPAGTFNDVPPSFWAAGYIERLSELGVTSGCGGGNFCPDWKAARDQMAVFMQRAFNLP